VATPGSLTISRVDPVTLTTDRLVLRTFRPQDTDAVYAAARDPEIQRWITLPSPYLPEHARSFTEQVVPRAWADGSACTFGLFLGSPDGDLVGAMSLHRGPEGTASIGYWCAKRHRGHGYMTEAARAVARWAFTRLAVDRLEWRAEVGNTASRRVAERVGFTVEGVLRSAHDHHGVRRDCWVGSLLPPDLGLPSTSPYLPAPRRD
jgi:RimJ/RimL family protein N-acetyltransferase